MIIKINAEQPFQVLSTTFSIGPSSSGYDLMASADGVNYSKLFTVGANVNRQVTQVAAGSYYYLAGNTGNVVVNWFGNCVVDNGGGGGGTPADYDAVKGQVSANTENIETLSGVTSGLTEAVGGKQDTLSAGNGIDLSGNTISVKIGEGLAFSGDTIVASGGTGGGDYMVVSGLPQTAQDGQLFYVPEHIENVQYYGLTLTTQETENFIGHLYDAGNNEKSVVYISGSDFYWDWENDGEVHKKEDFYYETDNQNKTFIFYAPDGWYITADNDTTTGETEGFSVQVTIAPATYRYIGDAFHKEVIKIKINDFKGSDYGFNSNSFYDYLQQFTEEELKQNFVFEHDGNYAKYEAFYENERYDFSVNASPVVFPIGPPAAVPTYHVYANYDGSVSDDGQRATNIKLPIVLNVNLANSGLTSTIGGLWVRICGDIYWGGNPVVTQIFDSNIEKVVGYTQNCWFRQAYDGDNSDWADMSTDNVKIFGCEWYQYGDKITAEWVLDVNGVVGGAPINWNVTSNVHSAADSTIPTNS